jgi:hypothetical protein
VDPRVKGIHRHQSSSAVRHVAFEPQTSAMNLRNTQRLDSENDDDSKDDRVTTLRGISYPSGHETHQDYESS